MTEEDLDVRYAGSRVKELSKGLSGDGKAIRNIVHWLLWSTHKRVRTNAAWILNNLCREDKLLYLAPYRNALTELAMGVLPFRRQMILSLLLDLTMEDMPRVDLLDYCLEHLHDERESASSRAFMIHLAARICSPYPELYTELLHTLDMLPATLPPSISSAKRKAYCRSKELIP